MASVERVEAEPTPPPPPTYVLTLSEEEAIALRSFIGDAVFSEGGTSLRSRAPLTAGVWDALAKAGARYDEGGSR